MESICSFNCNPREPQNSLQHGFLHPVSISCNVCGHEVATAWSNASASESMLALVPKKTQVVTGAFHTSRLFLVAPSCAVAVVTEEVSAHPEITFI